jgi:hypothetical protein
MEQSGYAYLFSEYHKSQGLWNEVKSVWDKYFEEHDPQKASLLLAAVNLTELAYEIPHRGTIRTAWGIRVSQYLRMLPRKEVYSRGSFPPNMPIGNR